MDDKFTVRKATENDISLIENLIKGLAAYEKRPQDMTCLLYTSPSPRDA